MPSTAYVTLTIMPDAHTKATSCALALTPPPRNPNERRELLPRRHREVDSVLLLFAVWRGFVDAVNRAAALGGRQSRGYHVRARKMDAVREELRMRVARIRSTSGSPPSSRPTSWTLSCAQAQTSS